MTYSTVHSGDPTTTNYRVYLQRDGKTISYLHDVPFVANAEKQTFNMVVEIPRNTKAKMEINMATEANPIKQDVKNGKLRIVDDVYPYHGYIWNYGAIPQSWEHPFTKNPDTGYYGDNDPLDLCEIGSALGQRGEIKEVKILGAMALIDEGETDWKIIGIDVNDPRADEFNDIDDVHRLLPGFAYATYEWFRTYKIPTGKPPNVFAFDGEAKNRAYALKVIEENHETWRKLVHGEFPAKTERYDIPIKNVTVEGSVAREEAGFLPEVLAFIPFTESENPLLVPEGVQGHAEHQQRLSPHGVASLGPVIGSLATAAAKGAESGVEGLVSTLKAAPVAALYSAESSEPLVSNPNESLTVFFHAKDGVVVFGVYLKANPNYIRFSLDKEVAAAGYDLIGAAYGSNGKFTYTTRHGVYTFTAEGLVEENPSVPEVSSDNLLAVRAPLAFFQ